MILRSSFLPKCQRQPFESIYFLSHQVATSSRIQFRSGRNVYSTLSLSHEMRRSPSGKSASWESSNSAHFYTSTVSFIATNLLSLASPQSHLPKRYIRLLHAEALIPTPKGCCRPPGRVLRAVLALQNWRETWERSKNAGVSISPDRQKKSQHFLGDWAVAEFSCSQSDEEAHWDTNHQTSWREQL